MVEMTFKKNGFVSKVYQIVDENLSNPNFGLNDLCKNLGMSRSQVYRKLKTHTGQSTSKVIRLYKLHKGKELLETTDLNISEVAYSVGFSSLSYFTRTFTEEFGKAPKEWRK